jgi:hypothetical protein
MKKNIEIVDGLNAATWKEIEKITRNYPKEIRFAQGTQAKIAMLKFYLDPILPDVPPPIERMDQGRMLTIAYRIYKEADGDIIKELCMKIINKVIN